MALTNCFVFSPNTTLTSKEKSFECYLHKYAKGIKLTHLYLNTGPKTA